MDLLPTVAALTAASIILGVLGLLALATLRFGVDSRPLDPREHWRSW